MNILAVALSESATMLNSITERNAGNVLQVATLPMDGTYQRKNYKIVEDGVFLPAASKTQV